MNVLASTAITATALDAEKMRVDITSQNIANAHTTQGLDGKPYQRRIVAFESVLNEQMGANMQGVRISDVKRDQTPGEIINNPEHPHADENGNVQMPNVNIAFEMVDMVTATRSYEANLAVVRNDTHAYVQFGNGDWLCFDLATDPTWQTRVTDATVVLPLAQQMLVWRQTHLDRQLTGTLVRRTGVAGRTPDPVIG